MDTNVCSLLITKPQANNVRLVFDSNCSANISIEN